jgi:hypothetical protein
VREVGVGADYLARDAGGEPAADAIGEAAVQRGLKNLISTSTCFTNILIFQ